MKKLTKALISSVCAVSMLASASMSASACDLTAEELFEKYASVAYTVEWDSQYGFYLDYICSEDSAKCYDADFNETDDVWAVSYLASNEYCYEPLAEGSRSRIYTCEYEEGFYYAIKDDGTAVIAGCDYDYMNEHTPTELLIPEQIGGAVVTEIARNAFMFAWNYYNEDLTHVSIPDTVESIHHGAFSDVFPSYKQGSCSINLPENIKFIGNIAFGGDTQWALGDVIVLPESTEFVHYNAFSYKHPQIQMPESLVFTTFLTIGLNHGHIVNRNEPDEIDLRHHDEEAAVAFVDGKYNTVTLFDARKYLIDKMTQQKPAGTQTAGDLNANGETDLSDAVLLSRAVGGTYALSAEASVAADLNNDGEINAADLAALMSLLAGN